jgi:pyrimidine operon attenuation protein/uracil phosphoribosyltransferase
VLADRGGRELPISARCVGASVLLGGTHQLVLSQDTQGHFSFRVESGPR